MRFDLAMPGGISCIDIEKCVKYNKLVIVKHTLEHNLSVGTVIGS